MLCIFYLKTFSLSLNFNLCFMFLKAQNFQRTTLESSSFRRLSKLSSSLRVSPDESCNGHCREIPITSFAQLNCCFTCSRRIHHFYSKILCFFEVLMPLFLINMNVSLPVYIPVKYPLL